MISSARWIIFLNSHRWRSNLRVFHKLGMVPRQWRRFRFNASDNQPRSIQIHPSDNVAIVVNEGGLPAGARLESGLVLREAIPEAHKVALTTILEGASVTRYGVTIGFARREISAGRWVHEGLLTVP